MCTKYMKRCSAVEEDGKEPYYFLKGMFMKRLPLVECCEVQARFH